MEHKFLISEAVDSMLLGLFIAITFTIRQTGILLLGILLITQAIHNYLKHSQLLNMSQESLSKLTATFPPNKREVLIQFLPYLVFLVLAGVWLAAFPGGGNYDVSAFNLLKITTLLYHLYYYLTIPADFFTPLNQSWLLLELFLIFTAWGIFRRYKIDYDFISFSFITILFIFFIPSLQGLRYILPVMPVLVYFCLWGIQHYSEEIQEKLRGLIRSGFFIALSGIVVIFAITLANDAIQNLRQGRIIVDGPYTKQAQEVLSFITDNTGEKDVIVFFKPRALHLFTRRPAVMLTNMEALERGDYLLLDLDIDPDWNPVGPDAAASLEKERKLELVYQNGTYRLYYVNHCVISQTCLE